MTKIMNQDALERLRNRAKPTVEKRDLSTISSVNSNEQSSLKNISVKEFEEGSKEESNSSNQEVEISTSVDIDNNSQSSLSGDVLDEDKLSSMELKTKQSTIRLEQGLSQKIIQRCQLEEISREVFLEALFVYFENHKSIQSKVLREARKRDKQRQKIANYRRAKSMIERFGSE